MRASSVHEIKQELAALSQKELVELGLRLARFKKENKELLTYLLFEARDEEQFIRGIQEEIETAFGEINLSHLYFAKKTLRRIARLINKYCRYSGEKETELRLRIYFCKKLRESGIPIDRNPVIRNLYHGQLKKLHSVLSGLHEDLQYDYRREITHL